MQLGFERGNCGGAELIFLNRGPITEARLVGEKRRHPLPFEKKSKEEEVESRGCRSNEGEVRAASGASGVGLRSAWGEITLFPHLGRSHSQSDVICT